VVYFIYAEVGVALSLYQYNKHELSKVNGVSFFYKETFTFHSRSQATDHLQKPHVFAAEIVG